MALSRPPIPAAPTRLPRVHLQSTSRPRANGASQLSIAQQLGEHDGVVVLAVTGGVDDGERGAPGATSQLVATLRTGGELVAIAGAKLVEALGNVIEPAASLVAGRQLARPLIDAGALVRDPSRPEWSISTR